MSEIPGIKAIVNNEKEFFLSEKFINKYDILKTGINTYHIFFNNKAYNLEVLETYDNKSYKVRIQNRIYTVSLHDEIDQIVETLGLATKTQQLLSEIKAPMPGMVLEVLVSQGQSISKGDNLIILEAMKMENIIKSPVDSIVKSIEVSKGASVDKNQVLIHLS